MGSHNDQQLSSMVAARSHFLQIGILGGLKRKLHFSMASWHKHSENDSELSKVMPPDLEIMPYTWPFLVAHPENITSFIMFSIEVPKMNRFETVLGFRGMY